MDKVVLSEADKRRMAFDAEHNVEPCRTIAERIVWNLGWDSRSGRSNQIVSAIAHAIEDARDLGEKRAAFTSALRSDSK